MVEAVVRKHFKTVATGGQIRSGYYSIGLHRIKWLVFRFGAFTAENINRDDAIANGTCQVEDYFYACNNK